MMRKIKIGWLQKTTLIDFPSKIACTVFLIGCNFRCPWCYNPELVLSEEIKKQLHPVKPSKAGISPLAKLFNRVGISEKDFFNFLKERKELLEAVTICGGEPCVNQDLPQFIKKIKKMGYSVKLDTNGSNPGMLKDLIDKKLIDYVAMDIKAPIGAKTQNSKLPKPSAVADSGAGKTQSHNLKFKNKYEQATGAKINLGNIEKSIKIIKSSGIDYEFRTTVVPGIHTKEDIIQIAKKISSAKKYYLQNFRPEKTIDPKFEKIKPYPDEYLIEIQKAISPFFEICQIR